ncbi:helix-turn-helix domain-containing protein [Dactylosporangium cerinum]
MTGAGLGSVGGHLRVLLDAGLVARRRSGRSVLYYQTPTGAAVAATDAGNA